ncbi:MAG: AAA family ATPase [Elusimicrobiota bacterium]
MAVLGSGAWDGIGTKAADLGTVIERALGISPEPKKSGQSASLQKTDPRTLEEPSEHELSAETREILAVAGLSYEDFRSLTAAQASFEQVLLSLEPGLKPYVSSLRTQRRFSRAMLSFARRFKESGEIAPFAKALLLALEHVYGDMRVLKDDDKAWSSLIALHFGAFLPEGLPLEDFGALAAQAQAALERSDKSIRSGSGKEPQKEEGLAGRIRRAFLTEDTVLFLLPKGGRRAFLDALRKKTAEDQAELRVLWSHPHEELQLIGHPVPREDREGVEFAYGELSRSIRRAAAELELAKAQGREPHAVVLLIENFEAMDHGVRMSLHEAVNTRVLTDPELGRLELPKNLRIFFSSAEGASVEDRSFYDRVLVKRMPSFAEPEAPVFKLPEGVTEENYLEHVSLRREGGAVLLALPGASIPLGPEYDGLFKEFFSREAMGKERGPANKERERAAKDALLEALYEKAGIVLDFDAARMLAAMQWARENGHPILRVQGPTGVGKTHAGSVLSRLLGIPFLSHPFDADSRFGDLLGRYRQDQDGFLRFHGDTVFKRTLEAGGLAALSEMNTLLGEDGKASFGWWLVQLAQAEKDRGGGRTVPLLEFPVAAAKESPSLHIPRGSLILVDTNPEGEYDARGKLPEALDELTPGLEVSALVADISRLQALSPLEVDRVADLEKARLSLHARLRLKKDWPAGTIGLEEFAGRVADVFRVVEGARVNGEFGLSEKRVFSLRELGRICDDAAALMRKGMDADSALSRAAYDHLAACWRSPSDQRFAASILRSRCRLHPKPAKLMDMLKDQLLDKGRPVHLRVNADTDLRGELEALQRQDPDMEIVFIPVTDQTDRFQLEGGLVPVEGTRKLQFRHGIFGRMAQKAAQAPGKKVLYVFENAHNLRPEVIVAANEFLQNGELHPADGVTVQKPANARMLFISRADSPINWSAAERSRLVEFSYRQGAAWLRARALEAFSAALPGRPQAAVFLARWSVLAYRAWERGLAGTDASRELASHARFLRWVQRTAQAVAGEKESSDMAGEKGAGAMAAAVEAVLKDVLLSALPEQGRELLEWELLSPLWRGMGAAGVSGPAGEFMRAASQLGESVKESLQTLLGLAKGVPEDGFKAAKPEEFKDGDMVSVEFAPKDFGLGYLRRAVVSADGRWTFGLGGNGLLKLFKAEKDDLSVVWSATPSALDTVDALAISEDGETLASAGQNADFNHYVCVWSKKSKGSSFKPVRVPIPHAAKQLFLSADGKTLLVLMDNGRVLAAGGISEQNVGLAHIEGADGMYTEAAALSPDGGTILLAHGALLRAYVRENRVFEQSGILIPAGEPVRSLALSRDGGRVFVAGNTRLHEFEKKASLSGDNRLYEEKGSMSALGVEGLSLSSDGSRLLLISGTRAKLLRLVGGIKDAAPAWTRNSRSSILAARAGEDSLSFVDDTSRGVVLRRFAPGKGVVNAGSVLFGDGASLPLHDLSGTAAKAELRANERERLAGPLLRRSSALSRVAAWFQRHRDALFWQAERTSRLKPLDLIRSGRPAMPGQILDAGSPALAVAVTPGGRFILAGTKDGTARLFQREAPGAYREVFNTSSDAPIVSVSISGDGKTLAFADEKNNIRVFAAQGEGYRQAWQRGGLGRRPYAPAVAVSADGRSVLAVQNGDARVLRSQGEGFSDHLFSELSGPQSRRHSFWISADGSTVVVGGSSKTGFGSGAEGWIQAYRREKDGIHYRKAWSTVLPDAVHAVAGTLDGSRIFAQIGAVPGQAAVQVPLSGWAPAGGLCVFEKRGELYEPVFQDGSMGGAESITVSPDSREFRLILYNGEVLLYREGPAGYERAESGRPRTIPAKNPGISPVYSADGSTSVEPDADGYLRIFSSREFMVQDSDTALELESGRAVALGELPESVEVLRAVRRDSAESVRPAGFEPRYGDLPFYFAADGQGKVFLRYLGRWYKTRHALLPGMKKLSGRPTQRAGEFGELKLLELNDLANPYTGEPLTEADFLLASPALEKAEASALEAFADDWGVYLVGGPGSGKTAAASELPLLLGLPRHTFLMHADRELSDLIGSFREDEYGRLVLTARPVRDAQGRLRFKPELLDMLVNGGVFNADEGAVGERARELLSWPALIARGEKKLILQEFPGSEIALERSPDFHLMLTSNDEEAQSRLRPKSELSAYLHAIRLDEENEAQALAGFFGRFLGASKESWRFAAAQAFLAVKSALGDHGGDLTRRELRRAARLFKGRSWGWIGEYDFYKVLRMVFAPFFPDSQRLSELLRSVLGRGQKVSGWEKRLLSDAAESFPAATAEESRVQEQAWTLLAAGEPVLLLPERGARTSEIAAALAKREGAAIETVDASPENDVREIIGGPFAVLGPRAENKPRARFLPGRLTRHLTQEGSSKVDPVIVWIRNMDQWPEEARTALNELLEKGYADLDAGEGRMRRFYKPAGLHFLAEGNPADISAPFLSRWAKVRVPEDSAARADEGTAPAQALRSLYGSTEEESRLLSALWNRLGRVFPLRGPQALLTDEHLAAVAKAVQAARREDPKLSAAGAVLFEAERIFGARISALEEGRKEALELLSAYLPGPDQPGASDARPKRFELKTGDGTLSSRIESIDGIPVRAGLKAASVLDALEHNGVRPTPESLRALALFARADSLSMPIALIGDPGALKSKLPELWAEITGRDFLKVQAHAGGTITDMTADISEDPQGDMTLRRKEFYESLRRGNTVILIDEANAAPWLLWVLEPLLRGEKTVSPMYPEEPSFTVGENVSIALAYNSDIRSGRFPVDARILDRVLLSRMSAPAGEELPDIIETFYGVWERLKTFVLPRSGSGDGKGRSRGKKAGAEKGKNPSEEGQGEGKEQGPEQGPQDRPDQEKKAQEEGQGQDKKESPGEQGSQAKSTEEPNPEAQEKGSDGKNGAEPQQKSGGSFGEQKQDQDKSGQAQPKPQSAGQGSQGGSGGQGSPASKPAPPQNKDGQDAAGKGSSAAAEEPQPPELVGAEAGSQEGFSAGARAESVLQRLLDAMRERSSRRWRKVKEGTRVDPVALALNREKKFLVREHAGALKKIAVSILMDFSISMKDVQSELGYAVSATGRDLWRLRDQQPGHFAYDLSWFAGGNEAITVVPFGAKLDGSENERRLAEMSKKAGKMGGTNIIGALRSKLKEMRASPEARRAQVRYLLLFTDGDKDGEGQAVAQSGGGYVLTPEMRKLAQEYRDAGIEIVVLGMGEGARQVAAFKGPGLHHVRLPGRKPALVTEAVVRAAEHLSLRASPLPEGDITRLLGL